jgi:autotransporter translocation and assembly factor TamB
VRGTWERLQYEGALAINIPRLGLQTAGVTLTSTTGSLRMADNRLVIDTLVGHSGGPFRVTGSVLLADMAHPVLDVRVIADEVRALDNAKGQLVVSSRLRWIRCPSTVP